MGSASDWHAFLDEFRAFGGKAENVMHRKGAFGMGLFPIDSAKPIDLLVPDISYNYKFNICYFRLI